MPVQANGNTWLVEGGDNLVTIAQKIYQNPRMFAEIMRLNNGILNIRPGMILKLPYGKPNEQIYISPDSATKMGMATPEQLRSFYSEKGNGASATDSGVFAGWKGSVGIAFANEKNGTSSAVNPTKQAGTSPTTTSYMNTYVDMPGTTAASPTSPAPSKPDYSNVPTGYNPNATYSGGAPMYKMVNETTYKPSVGIMGAVGQQPPVTTTKFVPMTGVSGQPSSVKSAYANIPTGYNPADTGKRPEMMYSPNSPYNVTGKTTTPTSLIRLPKTQTSYQIQTTDEMAQYASYDTTLGKLIIDIATYEQNKTPLPITLANYAIENFGIMADSKAFQYLNNLVKGDYENVSVTAPDKNLTFDEAIGNISTAIMDLGGGQPPMQLPEIRIQQGGGGGSSNNNSNSYNNYRPGGTATYRGF